MLGQIPIKLRYACYSVECEPDNQFFITYAKQTSLDGKYSIFGKQAQCRPLPQVEKLIYRVIDGAESTLDQMERVPVNPKNRPLEEIKMTSVSHTSHCMRDRADDRLRYTPIQLLMDRSRCLDHILASHLYLCTIVVQSHHITYYTTIWALFLRTCILLLSNYTMLPLLVSLYLTDRNLDGG